MRTITLCDGLLQVERGLGVHSTPGQMTSLGEGRLHHLAHLDTIFSVDKSMTMGEELYLLPELFF